jgi:hypothetical protein
VANKQLATIAKEISWSSRLFPSLEKREPERYAALLKAAGPHLRKLR